MAGKQGVKSKVDYSHIKNMPTDPKARLVKHNQILAVVIKDRVLNPATGRYRITEKTIGRVIDNVFYTTEEIYADTQKIKDKNRSQKLKAEVSVGEYLLPMGALMQSKLSYDLYQVYGKHDNFPSLMEAFASYLYLTDDQCFLNYESWAHKSCLQCYPIIKADEIKKYCKSFGEQEDLLKALFNKRLERTSDAPCYSVAISSLLAPTLDIYDVSEVSDDYEANSKASASKKVADKKASKSAEPSSLGMCVMLNGANHEPVSFEYLDNLAPQDDEGFYDPSAPTAKRKSSTSKSSDNFNNIVAHAKKHHSSQRLILDQGFLNEANLEAASKAGLETVIELDTNQEWLKDIVRERLNDLMSESLLVPGFNKITGISLEQGIDLTKSKSKKKSSATTVSIYLDLAARQDMVHEFYGELYRIQEDIASGGQCPVEYLPFFHLENVGKKFRFEIDEDLAQEHVLMYGIFANVSNFKHYLVDNLKDHNSLNEIKHSFAIFTQDLHLDDPKQKAILLGRSLISYLNLIIKAHLQLKLQTPLKGKKSLALKSYDLEKLKGVLCYIKASIYNDGTISLTPCPDRLHDVFEHFGCLYALEAIKQVNNCIEETYDL